MEPVTPRFLATWLAGALTLALAIVGGGAIMSTGGVTTPLASGKVLDVRPSAVSRCLMANGNAGLKISNVCHAVQLPGGIGVAPGRVIMGDGQGRMGSMGTPGMLQRVSFLTLPDSRECQRSILSPGVFSA